jgi:hypothetical protein
LTSQAPYLTLDFENLNFDFNNPKLEFQNPKFDFEKPTFDFESQLLDFQSQQKIGRGWEKWRIPSLLGHSWGTPGAPGDPKFDFDFEGRLVAFQSQKKIRVSLVQEGEVGKSGFFYHSRRLPWVGKMASVGVDGGSSRSWQG